MSDTIGLVGTAVNVLIDLYKDVKEKSVDKDYLIKLEDEISKRFFVEEPTKENNIEDLINAHKNENLALVLGAGVSTEHKVPTWNTLLQRLLLNAFEVETNQQKEKSKVLSKLFTELFPTSPLIAARYLCKYYEGDESTVKESFEEAVRNAIYEGIDLENEKDLFKEIRQLCTAPGKNPNLNCIITYNYDDIIEHYLSKSNVEIQYKSIYSTGMNPEYNELPIYHVHGFLPRNDTLNKTNKITFSEDIYHQQYNDIYSWNNIIQINKFRDNICLFIGISFTDPNLRRLLDIAKTQRGNMSKSHYLIKKRYDNNAISNSLTEILQQNNNLLDAKGNAELSFDETVTYLLNVIQKFEENDALSFGVRTIWVDDFSEVPLLLKQIRKGTKEML